MIAATNNNLYTITRVHFLCNLAFLFTVLFCSCNNKNDGIKIVWIDHKAAALYLPADLFKDTPHDSIIKFFRISLSNDKDSTTILGDLKMEHNFIFEPLIPFSRGSVYEVFYRNKIIGTFSVPVADKKASTELVACYPEQDTLPENLLKFYLAFSSPMSEGHSENYLTVIRNNKDTLKGVFLNLQPELWNEDRTVMTVWLDPGRIKRGLQPNLRLGAPLKDGDFYQLIISGQWKDAQGLPLQQDFSKLFRAAKRDSAGPDPARWKLSLPAKDSKQAVEITPDETLDHFLFAEALHIKNQDSITVPGKFEIYNHDKNCRFVPATQWVPGNYFLVIESRLEDLAGNNLNRPFDRDITGTREPSTKVTHEIKFKIE